MAEINSKKEVYKLIIILAILGLIGGGFLLYLSIPLLSDTSVILSTQPVDPFDPIRGQYMIISYEINSIPKLENAKNGNKIYVLLEEDENGISRYKSASFTKHKGIFIKGEVTSVRENTMRVKYGIEQYFFERGARFQTRINNVEVKLSSGGRSTISKILDENKEPVKITYRNITLTS
jgi:uncharacterized membrane-anchored protein